MIVADDGSRDATAERRRGGRRRRSCGCRAAARARRCRSPSERRRRGPLLLRRRRRRGDLRGPRAAAPRPRVSRGSRSGRAAASASRSGSRARLIGLRGAARGARAALGPAGARCATRAQRCFPLAPGFGAETRMTIDAARAGAPGRGGRARPRAPRDRPRPRAGSSTAAGSSSTCCSRRAAAGQLPRAAAAARRLAGRGCTSRSSPRSGSPTTSGRARSAASAPTCAHGRTTGVLKLVGIPLYGLLRTRSVSGALLVGLAANALNQLDTRPGPRAEGVPRGGARTRTRRFGVAVLLAPYDLREMAMLGDAGANALGALLGLNSVDGITGRGRWLAIGALARPHRSRRAHLSRRLIERTPFLRDVDAWGRSP